MDLELVTSLAQLPADEWDALAPSGHPLLSHAFLYGLERTGCTDAESGWQPCHLRLREAGQTLALVPSYLKSHSYGEYVFDWSWADAWHRSGLQYYPKLVSAVPFTPATGPRILMAPDADQPRVLESLIAGVQQWSAQRDISSWHILFPEQAVADSLAEQGLHTRLATQFHWLNRGYRDFDDFLSTFTSRKRKSLRRERKRVQEQGLELETLVGDQITADNWDRFYRFYQVTYAKRSGHGGYLSREFFTETAAGLGDRVMMVVAGYQGESVGAALYFRSDDTLFGRYWGCDREFDCLHFETCYYRGIEFCIEHGLQRFDPGAQGEHKIQRGFEPVPTYSSHWIAEPGLSQAVGDFTRREAEHSEAYRREAATLLPFRKGDN